MIRQSLLPIAFAVDILKPDSIETFTVFLGPGESIFGKYLGYIFKSLFAKQAPPPGLPEQSGKKP